MLLYAKNIIKNLNCNSSKQRNDSKELCYRLRQKRRTTKRKIKNTEATTPPIMPAFFMLAIAGGKGFYWFIANMFLRFLKGTKRIRSKAA